MEKIIKELSPRDFLNEFGNFHLKELIKAQINIGLFEKLDPKEVVGEKQYPAGQDKGFGILRITAQEILNQEIKKEKEQQKILDIINLLKQKYE